MQTKRCFSAAMAGLPFACATAARLCGAYASRSKAARPAEARGPSGKLAQHRPPAAKLSSRPGWRRQQSRQVQRWERRRQVQERELTPRKQAQRGSGVEITENTLFFI
eukprot:4663022-Pleurochrysis_carterae.AAC.4